MPLSHANMPQPHFGNTEHLLISFDGRPCAQQKEKQCSIKCEFFPFVISVYIAFVVSNGIQLTGLTNARTQKMLSAEKVRVEIENKL